MGVGTWHSRARRTTRPARPARTCRRTNVSGNSSTSWKARRCCTRRWGRGRPGLWTTGSSPRSEEHTSELQSREKLVCRVMLEKKNYTLHYVSSTSSLQDTSTRELDG